MTTLLRLSIAAGLALATFAGGGASQTPRQSAPTNAPTPVDPPKHILYRVHGPNGATVYLLGSVHLLSADASSLPPQVDTAFECAHSVTLETNLDSAMARGPELLMRGRFTDGQTLRGSLSPENAAAVDSLLRGFGVTLDQVNSFKPWFVSMLIAQMSLQKMNFQPQYGVDIQINTRAKQAHKPVYGLESVDFQLGMFDRLPVADQQRLLIDSDPLDAAARELGAIRDAWTHGDAFALDSLINRRMGEAPALLDALLISRNRAWIPKIEALITGHDDALVVVGSGHLVGKQSVVELLRAKGYTVDQM